MFDYGQPCPASESVDLPINTTALANGQHTLKIVVQDAAGNSAVVYDGTISTKQPAKNSLGAHARPRHERGQLVGSHAGCPERDDGEPHGAAHSRAQAQDHPQLRAPRAAGHWAPARRAGPSDRRRDAGSAAAGQRLADSDGDRARAALARMGHSRRRCPADPRGRSRSPTGRSPRTRTTRHWQRFRSQSAPRYGSMSARAARAPKARSHSAAGCSARSQLREWWSSCLSIIEAIGSHSAIRAQTRAVAFTSSTNSKAASGGSRSGPWCLATNPGSPSYTAKARQSMSPRTDMPSTGAHYNRSSSWRAVLVCVALILVAGGALASSAQAGTWTLVSCTQPDGRPAPTEGWSTSATGAVGPDQRRHQHLRTRGQPRAPSRAAKRLNAHTKDPSGSSPPRPAPRSREAA